MSKAILILVLIFAIVAGFIYAGAKQMVTAPKAETAASILASES